MSDYWSGLLVEGTGIAIELAIVYLIIWSLLDRHEKTKWRPARLRVVRALDRSFKTLFNAAFNVINPDTTTGPPEKDIERRKVYLEMAQHDLDELKRVVDLHNAALDPEIMGETSKFLENADVLLDKLYYFGNVYAPIENNVIYVSHPPFEECRAISEADAQLRKSYASALSAEGGLGESARTVEAIEDAWVRAEDAKENLSFDLENYEHRTDRLPVVYDRASLQQLPIPAGEGDFGAKVFNTNR